MDYESAAKAAWNRKRVELPDADPTAKATLPVTRLEEMLSRGQLTDSELHLALMFRANPCGRKVLKGYYAVVVGIVLHDKPAGELADPRVDRSKGIAEVMRKLRTGLRLMVDHYLPSEPDEDEVAQQRHDAETLRQTDFYKRLQEHERNSDYRDPSGGYFDLAPQPASETFGTHYSTEPYSAEFGHCGRSPLSIGYCDEVLPVSIDAHVRAWFSRKPDAYGARKWRGQMAQQMWSAQMRRASLIKAAYRSMPKARRRMLVTGAGANDAATYRVKAARKMVSH